MHQMLYALVFLAMVVCPAAYVITWEAGDRRSR
jgi:hypothetical protein